MFFLELHVSLLDLARYLDELARLAPLRSALARALPDLTRCAHAGCREVPALLPLVMEALAALTSQRERLRPLAAAAVAPLQAARARLEEQARLQAYLLSRTDLLPPEDPRWGREHRLLVLHTAFASALQRVLTRPDLPHLTSEQGDIDRAANAALASPSGPPQPPLSATRTVSANPPAVPRPAPPRSEAPSSAGRSLSFRPLPSDPPDPEPPAVTSQDPAALPAPMEAQPALPALQDATPSQTGTVTEPQPTEPLALHPEEPSPSDQQGAVSGFPPPALASVQEEDLPPAEGAEREFAREAAPEPSDTPEATPREPVQGPAAVPATVVLMHDSQIDSTSPTKKRTLSQTQVPGAGATVPLPVPAGGGPAHGPGPGSGSGSKEGEGGSGVGPSPHPFKLTQGLAPTPAPPTLPPPPEGPEPAPKRPRTSASLEMPPASPPVLTAPGTTQGTPLLLAQVPPPPPPRFESSGSQPGRVLLGSDPHSQPHQVLSDSPFKTPAVCLARARPSSQGKENEGAPPSEVGGARPEPGPTQLGESGDTPLPSGLGVQGLALDGDLLLSFFEFGGRKAQTGLGNPGG